MRIKSVFAKHKNFERGGRGDYCSGFAGGGGVGNVEKEILAKAKVVSIACRNRASVSLISNRRRRLWK